MITDEVKITVTAGNGGNGLAVFSRIKFMKGPTGGNGGNGGNIFFEGIEDIGALRQFRFKKECKADNGKIGKQGPRDGAKAKDLTLFLPVGTVCHNLNNGKNIEITKIGQKELIAKGGKGGKGNWSFRSSTNTTPRQCEEGQPGENFELRLELKMIADVGFVGLPNVGKSSLLNELTNANTKVANYPFTTLEPHLGVYHSLVLADIPGLIEGASAGKGLGDKFLRHIERTKILFHIVSAESNNPIKDYRSVRNELEDYSDSLLQKPEYIFISKSDLTAPEKIIEIKDSFKKIDEKALPISIIDPGSLKEVEKILNNLILEKKVV